MATTLPTSTPVVPPDTTSTPSTSSTSSTSSSLTSSSAISSSSSISTPSSTSLPSSSSTPSTIAPPSTSTSSTSSQHISTRPDGSLITLTLTQTSAPTQSSTGGGGGTGFFDNKAQVAAVFSVAGIIGLVLLFLLVTTCIRRRRARKFDRDVAEAAAAAAAASADPFFEDEERGGANWDPRRTSAAYSGGGYGKLNEDPYAYAAPGVVGGAGFTRNGTQYSQQRNPRDQYSMNDLGSPGHPSSGYTHSTVYTPTPNPYYAEQPQIDYGRPSFGSNAPGIAGVGSGGGAQQYGQDNQNLRYRGGQQQSNFTGVEDAYGGYTMTAAIPSDGERYPNPYASRPTSTAYSQNPVRRSTNASPPLPPVPVSNSPPPRSPRSPPPPPSYSGHGHGPGQTSQGELSKSGRPLSLDLQAAPMPPPNMPLPPAPGTPEESWNDRHGVLRVANE